MLREFFSRRCRGRLSSPFACTHRSMASRGPASKPTSEHGAAHTSLAQRAQPFANFGASR